MDIVFRSRLFDQLSDSVRIAVVSAPAGSGKTVLLRSWIDQAGLRDRAAWVSVPRGEQDSHRLWLAVLDALRHTTPGGSLIRPLTPAPGVDGWAIVERLLADLDRLDEPLWLIIDDLHELGLEAQRQLELLILRAPAGLRLVLGTRQDLQLGLHRLRLDGELVEIRDHDLRFTTAEAGELLAATGVALRDPGPLVKRTEGWAAGLRLAALSLAGNPDPEQFARQFAGTERTVSEYLLDEVLHRQPERVRRLLLRTSILERITGDLADLLTGDSGSERVLQDLEDANAFVVSLDARRSEFRFHHLFADLLRLELRRVEPEAVTTLHRHASGWYAAHGYPAEAVRHAQAAGDVDQAARLLADKAPLLHLRGEMATVHELLAGFPAGAAQADPELANVFASDEFLHQGSLAAADQYLELAQRGMASVPADRLGPLRVRIGMVTMMVRVRQGDPRAAEECRRVLDLVRTSDVDQAGYGDAARGLALNSLGFIELWAGQPGEAESRFEAAAAVARRIGQPQIELAALAYRSAAEYFTSLPRAARRARQAIELAERHGWADRGLTGIAYAVLGTALAWQGRTEQGRPWIEHAESVIRAQTEPILRLLVYYGRGSLELVSGRNAEALAALRVSQAVGLQSAAPDRLVTSMRALELHALIRMGRLEEAERTLTNPDAIRIRDTAPIRISEAALRLAQGDPRAAASVLAPVLDDSARLERSAFLVRGLLMDAIARDQLGDTSASDRALDRALALAEPEGAAAYFLVHPAPGLLERHARRCTAHPALIADVLNLLSGRTPASLADTRPQLAEPLTESEIRVLRYLPTSLRVPEIAKELSVSPNTVKTHVRHLAAKFGTHTRAETVERARALALLAPARHR